MKPEPTLMRPAGAHTLDGTVSGEGAPSDGASHRLPSFAPPARATVASRFFHRGIHSAKSLILLLATLLLQAATSFAATTVIVVVGAAGEDEFGQKFYQWADTWQKVCDQSGARCVAVRPTAAEQTLDRLKRETGSGEFAERSAKDVEDRDRLKQLLAAEPKDSNEDLWLVLIGHGTFDNKQAKFNLRGPDLAATELVEWLKPFHRPLAVINCASASAPFLSALAAPGRVVISATRSGNEINFARFGQYFAEAVTSPAADLDKDSQTSLLEAFLTASRRVQEFYDSEGRLATEHPLLEDSGDGLGTPPDWFRGIRATKKAKDGASLDGLRAHQFHLLRSDQERQLSADVRARRDQIELAIAKLRDEKKDLEEDVYYERLEPLLLELARLYGTVAAKP
jgi:hypothetical protein